jgi:hypothetical protein
MPIILATWEAKIKRIVAQEQWEYILLKIPSPKYMEQNGLKQNGLEVWLKW